MKEYYSRGFDKNVFWKNQISAAFHSFHGNLRQIAKPLPSHCHLFYTLRKVRVFQIWTKLRLDGG